MRIEFSYQKLAKLMLPNNLNLLLTLCSIKVVKARGTKMMRTIMTRHCKDGEEKKNEFSAHFKCLVIVHNE